MNPSSDQDFLNELREIFHTEAQEHLETITSGLLQLENPKEDTELASVIEEVFRSAHSLKGAARTVNIPEIGGICQSMESVFSEVKNRGMKLEPDDFDVLQQAMDILIEIVSSPRMSSTGRSGPIIDALNQILKKESTIEKKREPTQKTPEPIQKKPEPAPKAPELDQVKENHFKSTEPDEEREKEVLPGAPPLGKAHASESQTIRISTAKLDSILAQAEELISVKLAYQQRLMDTQALMEDVGVWKKEWLKVADDWSISKIHELEKRISDILQSMHLDHKNSCAITDQLLDETKGLMMLPFHSLLQPMPKMVRDLSREMEKDVDFVMEGGDVEADKRILEKMKDPLIHMVRNSIDHGIETPQERRLAGKREKARLLIRVVHTQANRVSIDIEDDGRGIDPDHLKEKALSKKLITPEEAERMDDQTALNLIFRSGFSTSAIISSLSGRGLGMAIVQEAIDHLGGTFTISSKINEGTKISILLPLKLATFRAILVQSRQQTFAIPTSSVDLVGRFQMEQIHWTENRQMLKVRDELVSLVDIGDVLGLTGPQMRLDEEDGSQTKAYPFIILQSGGSKIAFQIDRIINEQEILIKEMGPMLVKINHLAGASVLGTGEVIPVLDVSDMFRTTSTTQFTGSLLRQSADTVKKKTSILIAEDSITSRTLLKNILSAAGYEVQTSVDGSEAWDLLQNKPFDAVVTDVEMPRMDGFDLTAHIREDNRFSELPVVLVTSLESPAHRERGAEVGANAYIVKSDFDQTTLLQVLKQLTG